jgi:type I restriction enzyme, S subunit
MANVFQEIPIEQLCTKVTAGSTPLRSRSDFYDDGATDWYKTGELKDWYLEPSEERITKKALEETSVKLFPANTVLMAMYGDGRTITSLGMLRAPAATNQACSAMLVDEEKCDTRYFFYALKGRRHLLLKVASGGAQRNLSGKLIKEFKLPVPPLPVQRRIAGILSAYDELIENSQRRIRILEETARALYREWFVHFRFPGHDKLPRVASPLGDIPRGWEVKLVKDILSRRAAGTVYRDEVVKPEGAIPVLDQSTNELLGFHDNEPDHLASPTMPMAIFGDHTCKMQLLIEPFSVGPNVVPFAAGRELPTAYAFFAVNSLVQTQEYKRHWIPLNAKEVIVADRVLAQRFASLIQPMLVEQATLRKAIRNLRRTRDLLLPRLLSDQVNLEEN